VTTCFRYLNCQSVAGGQYKVVWTQPDIDCSTARYKRFKGLAIVGIVFLVLLLPVLIVGLLFRYRDRIKPNTPFSRRWGAFFDAYRFPGGLVPHKALNRSRDSSQVELSTIDQLDIKAQGGDASVSKGRRLEREPGRMEKCWEHGLSTSTFWYEGVVMFRRAIYVAFDVILFSSRVSKYTVFTFLSATFLMLHLWTRPFHKAVDNQLETGSLVLITALSILLALQADSVQVTVDVIIFLVAGLPTILFLMYYLFDRGLGISGRVRNWMLDRERTQALALQEQWRASKRDLRLPQSGGPVSPDAPGHLERPSMIMQGEDPVALESGDPSSRTPSPQKSPPTSPSEPDGPVSRPAAATNPAFAGMDDWLAPA